MAADPLPGITLNKCSVNSTLSEWIVDIDGAPDTAYEGEKFQLQFKFCPSYPLKSPQVIFLGPNIPVNPHVYSNGHICLSILSNEWNPTSSTQSICLSIISMLSSCKEKKRPIDDILYVATCNKDPRKTIWWYHDDSV
ncbi:ubiquitin-conjugating enzyme e2 w [Plakobranchus ocellatus]|uniref:N-terminal E2 ubiquitin-conjugating enzyme n=1 Tax=Plakobranchus ocellatus TaxID=259542 RepID=A0AAV3YAB5_9GAST|nr:ubiquitin-conjugating enzyme e2 w [Plakobranchus ocellatus]